MSNVLLVTDDYREYYICCPQLLLCCQFIPPKICELNIFARQQLTVNWNNNKSAVFCIKQQTK